MTKMMNGTIVCIFLGLVILYEYSTWTECLEKNSFGFCFRVLVK